MPVSSAKPRLTGQRTSARPPCAARPSCNYHAVKRRALRRTSRSSTGSNVLDGFHGHGPLRVLRLPVSLHWCLARDREVGQQDRMDDDFSVC